MQTKKRSFPYLALALTLMLIGAPALAAARGGHKAFKHGGPFRMLLSHRADLDLNDDQVKQIEALQTQQRERTKDQRESLQAKHRALSDLLEADKLDRAEADRRIDALASEMTELHRARLQALLDVAEILTPEQRDKLREIRQAKRAEWGGRHGGPPPLP